MTKEDKAVIWFILGFLAFAFILLGGVFKQAWVIWLGVAVGAVWVGLLVHIQKSDSDDDPLP